MKFLGLLTGQIDIHFPAAAAKKEGKEQKKSGSLWQTAHQRALHAAHHWQWQRAQSASQLALCAVSMRQRTLVPAVFVPPLLHARIFRYRGLALRPPAATLQQLELFIYLFICISLACLGGLATSCEDIFINHLCEWVGVSEKRKIRTSERERMNLVGAARKQALHVWSERNGRVRQHFILIHFIIFKCCTTGTESRRTVVSHQLRSRCLLIFPA